MALAKTLYSVSMNTDTIKEPIFVYWEEMEQKMFKEITSGYQKILKFTFCLKKDNSEIRIFSARPEANLLLRRLRREECLHCKPIKFDFKKITELEDMECAWGIWEDHEGVERKRARFGKGINTIIEVGEFETITTVYMDYTYGGETIQLIVSVDGRVSSHSKSIKESDIITLFDELRAVLI